MKVAIVGTRTYPDLEQVRDFVRQLSPDDIVISGGAKGVDETAEDEARKLGMEVISVTPEWDKYGRRAGLMRNDIIVGMADCVVAFWDGVSRGTKYTIDKAKKKSVITQVFNVVN
ncbi:DNA uptake Rossmann fold nucleotide-binding protein [uncultured Mediterranean phage]|nr:DNA uptake Rossmann fold nucleotide-binding protein [uncultured Mediterranean phage]